MAAKLTTRIVDVWVAAACRVHLTFITGEHGMFTIVSRDRRHFETACGCKFDRSDVTHWVRLNYGSDTPVNVFHFDSTGQAYDACQCDDNIKNGDVLVITSEGVVGLADTWPVAVTKAYGNLHRPSEGRTIEQALTAKMLRGLPIALELINQYRFEANT